MKPLFVALDFPTWEDSRNFLEKNELSKVPVKVGMELFYREGIRVIEQLKERGHPIFLDLKLHDIPTTVMRAIRNLASLEVEIINVHALGGSDMMKRAKEGLQSATHQQTKSKLIAVTILTSMDEAALKRDLQLQGSVEEHALHLATVAHQSGADGVVCSVHEAAKIKAACGEDFLTVTPGIRLATSDVNDQKRVATPAVARASQSDIMVVGRSITKAENPLQAYHQVIEEWNNGITN